MYFPKGDKLNSILPLRCPQCHRGKFLAHPPFKIFKLTRVRDTCDHCGLKFKIEPSFYYGSMYVAYAQGVGLMVGTSIGYWLLSSNFSILECFLWVLGVILAFGPFLNGYAKIIWANFFINYDSNKAKTK